MTLQEMENHHESYHTDRSMAYNPMESSHTRIRKVVKIQKRSKPKRKQWTKKKEKKR